MNRITKEKTGEFQVIDTAGAKHTILIFQDITETTDLDGEIDRQIGLPGFEMTNQNKVNQMSDGTYKEVRTGRVMRRLP